MARSRGSRRVGLPRVVGALLALLMLAAAGLAVWKALDTVQSRIVLRERCTATGAGRRVSLDAEQAANAATIAAVGQRSGVSERGVAIGLATAMQESKLRNLRYGDRDSLGLFQQRPSQGWGTRAEILDPVYASTRFFRALREVPSYGSLPMEDAAQRVQRSAYGDAYAKHEPDALALAAVLTGRVPGGMTCALKVPDLSAQTPGESGLTPRARELRRQIERVFGPQRVSGLAPPAVGARSGGSVGTDGLAFDVRVQAGEGEQGRTGWALAHWLVANAERLDVAVVRYDDRVWSAEASARGWQTDLAAIRSDPASRADPDPVHVEVLRGG